VNEFSRAFRRNVALAAALAATTLAVPTARAQIMSNPAQWYVNNQMYSTRVFNGVVANSTLNRSGRGKGKSPRSGGAAKDYTTFKETATSPLAKTLAGKASDPAGAESAKSMVKAARELYRKTARERGFPPNDLAFAFGYFVINNYLIAKNLVELPPDKDPDARKARDGFERIEILGNKKPLRVTPDHERAVYNQFKSLLNENATVRKMTDTQKQEVAETFALMVAVNYARYMEGVNSGDDAVIEEARRAARQGLEKLLGVPAGKITLSYKGLEIG
jgi:hypothetical protein